MSSFPAITYKCHIIFTINHSIIFYICIILQLILHRLIFYMVLRSINNMRRKAARSLHVEN